MLVLETVREETDDFGDLKEGRLEFLEIDGVLIDGNLGGISRHAPLSKHGGIQSARGNKRLRGPAQPGSQVALLGAQLDFLRSDPLEDKVILAFVRPPHHVGGFFPSR